MVGTKGIPVSGSYVVLTSSLDTGVSFTVNFASMAKYVTQQVNVPTAQVPIYPNYRFGYDAQEKVDEVAGIGNHYTALYWEYDPRDVKRWNVDPRPTTGTGSYSVFNNNPIVFTDYLGDTTVMYTTKGEKIGTLNDNLKNEVHFYNMQDDADIGNLSKLIKTVNGYNKGTINAAAGHLRTLSAAYMGEKSAANLKSLASKSMKLQREIGYVADISSSREILFKEIPLPKNNTADNVTFPLQKAVQEYFSYNQQTTLFGLGHTHFSGYETMSSSSKLALLNTFGTPTWSTQVERSLGVKVREGHDYKSVLPPSPNNPYTGRVTPLFISSPIGVTIYNNNTVNPDQQTRMFYDWYKK